MSCSDFVTLACGGRQAGALAQLLATQPPDCPVHDRFMIKRAQGRKRFGMKNFKKRWFRLTNHEFTYQKSKGNKKRSLFRSHILFQGTRASSWAPWGPDCFWGEHFLTREAGAPRGWLGWRGERSALHG